MELDDDSSHDLARSQKLVGTSANATSLAPDSLERGNREIVVDKFSMHAGSDDRLSRTVSERRRAASRQQSSDGHLSLQQNSEHSGGARSQSNRLGRKRSARRHTQAGRDGAATPGGSLLQ